MMRVFIAVLVAVLAIPVMAAAQTPSGAVGAWCGGSYGAAGTSFGQCVNVEGSAQVAGEASGVRGSVMTSEPEYPASKVSFDGDKAFYGDDKQPLHLNWVKGRDLSGELQSPGD